MIFQPDIFSNNRPIWNQVAEIEVKLFKDICKYIPHTYVLDIDKVYFSGAFEINSNNYRIQSTDGKNILLKKWPTKTQEKSINRIQKLTKWLDKQNIPVPKPGLFVDEKYVLNYDGSLWSFNLFSVGNYYSGTYNELESVARVSGKLATTLINLPSDLVPDRGPFHLSHDDNFIIKKMVLERDNWVNYFGSEYTTILNLYWDYIYYTWNNLYKTDINCGPVVPCHFDMHPHNLIVNKGDIVAVLDFDSCKKIPLGYSLAFNTLKQLRQFFSLQKEITTYSKIVDIYFKNLIKEIPYEELANYDFLKLSKIEVIRRICLIFRINIMDNNKQWNHVLPIQIAHLFEADKLFKKQV